jgi:hypothetical protein
MAGISVSSVGKILAEPGLPPDRAGAACGLLPSAAVRVLRAGTARWRARSTRMSSEGKIALRVRRPPAG